MLTRAHALTHARRCVYIYTNTRTNTGAYSEAHTQWYTHEQLYSHALTLTCTHTLMHPLSHAPTLSLTHTRMILRSHALTHATIFTGTLTCIHCIHCRSADGVRSLHLSAILDHRRDLLVRCLFPHVWSSRAGHYTSAQLVGWYASKKTSINIRSKRAGYCIILTNCASTSIMCGINFTNYVSMWSCAHSCIPTNLYAGSQNCTCTLTHLQTHPFAYAQASIYFHYYIHSFFCAEPLVSASSQLWEGF